MDFGKFKYEEGLKQKQARKHAQRHVVKEIKFHPNVAEHDYDTKLNHARDFLEKGHKVKVSLTFRGRENAHRELGFALVNRVIKDLEAAAVIDMAPRMMGRSVVCMLGVRPARVAK
jgi:translation initiation factor IF-3